MTPEQTGEVLTTVAAYDRRTIGRADVIAWHHAIGDLDHADAVEAVIRHYTDSTEWLMPAHVRRIVRQIRGERLATAPIDAPPADPDDEVAYRRALAEITRRAGDGRTPFKAITAGGGAAPSRMYRAGRTSEDHHRVLAQTVACPVEWCPARAGEPCRNPQSGERLAKWHPSRLTAAREMSTAS